MNECKVRRAQADFRVQRETAQGEVDTLCFSIEGRGPDTLGELGAYVATRIDAFVSGLSAEARLVDELRAEISALKAQLKAGKETAPDAEVKDTPRRRAR